jgi:chromosome segregation ATPase
MAFEPRGMSDVRDKYGQLKSVLATFNKKVSDVLSKAELQFLQAYRAHMQGVHREKQELESKLQEAENEQANDKQIQSLEKDRDWYRAQKQQLEGYVGAMQKDIIYMEEKYELLSKDRDFLAKQLKAAKKQFRVLRADIEARREARGLVSSVLVRTRRSVVRSVHVHVHVRECAEFKGGGWWVTE